MNGIAHLAELRAALDQFERTELARIDGWGRHLARVLRRGGRLLTAGNGGSAAHAQHLAAELVGRYRDEREPLSALALHSDTSVLTAIANDYGPLEAFARQVRAHGRPGDVLLCISTSGASGNVIAASQAAHDIGLTTWCLTGPTPNALARVCEDTCGVRSNATPTIQEVHQVAVHLLCDAVEHAISDRTVARTGAVA